GRPDYGLRPGVCPAACGGPSGLDAVALPGRSGGKLGVATGAVAGHGASAARELAGLVAPQCDEATDRAVHRDFDEIPGPASGRILRVPGADDAWCFPL